MEVLATDLRYYYPLLFFLQGNSLGEDESFGPRSVTELDMNPGSPACDS